MRGQILMDLKWEPLFILDDIENEKCIRALDVRLREEILDKGVELFPGSESRYH